MFTVVMVDATKELWDIHDCVPVILRPEDHATWLNAPTEEAMRLLRKYPADQLAVDRTNTLWVRG